MVPSALGRRCLRLLKDNLSFAIAPSYRTSFSLLIRGVMSHSFHQLVLCSLRKAINGNDFAKQDHAQCRSVAAAHLLRLASDIIRLSTTLEGVEDTLWAPVSKVKQDVTESAPLCILVGALELAFKHVSNLRQGQRTCQSTSSDAAEENQLTDYTFQILEFNNEGARFSRLVFGAGESNEIFWCNREAARVLIDESEAPGMPEWRETRQIEFDALRDLDPNVLALAYFNNISTLLEARKTNPRWRKHPSVPVKVSRVQKHPREKQTKVLKTHTRSVATGWMCKAGFANYLTDTLWCG